MRTTTLLAVFCTAVLISCEPVSEPELNVPDPSFAVDPVVLSAFGSGNFIRPWGPSPGGWRTFSLHARRSAEGTVDGQFQFNDHDVDIPNYDYDKVRGIADVTCMSTDGNAVWIGGYFTKHTNPENIGRAARLRVMDNGEGANASPDVISYIYPGGDAQTFCNNMPELTWIEVESGNIVVKGLVD